jgi:ABC-type uncharacterized transport system substrate-binding protein
MRTEVGQQEPKSVLLRSNRSILIAQHSVLCIALCALLLTPCTPAHAQQPKKVFRIGFMSATQPQPRDEAFRQSLRDLGYREGENIVIEWRYAKGKLDRVSRMAADLVRLQVDVVVTTGPTDTRAIKNATASIPIVMAQDTDPVGNGFVASLARPGGNVTGLSTVTPQISGKQFDILKDIFPKLGHIAVLGTSSNPGEAQTLKEMKTAAKAVGVELQYFDARDPKTIDHAMNAASKAHVDALVALPSPVLVLHQKQLADLALSYRLPTMYNRRAFVEHGGLMSYGASIDDLFHRAAIYVDKILKGAKPADLPVEQPTKFEFIVNLKTAQQIGLTIPPNVLARADRVIR